MNLIERSKEKTPEFFYSKYDEENQTWLETETIVESDHVRLRRKAVDGWQDIEFYEDHLKLLHVTIDNDGNEVSESIAEGQIYLEYIDWDLNDWVHYSFGPAVISVLDDGRVKCVQSDGLVSLEIVVEWKIGSAKQVYFATYGGKKIRVGGIVKVLNSEKLIMDYSDFLGMGLVDDQTTVIEGETFRFLKFASDGVDDELEVDPYLSLEEESSYTDVHCDGFVIRVYENNADYVCLLKSNDGSTNYYDFYPRIHPEAGGFYPMLYDVTRTMTIHENSGTRVILKVTGILDGTYGSTSNPLPNSGGVVMTIVIYSDRIIIDVEWETIGDVEVISSVYQASLVYCYHFPVGTGVDLCENNGSESILPNYSAMPEADYLLRKQDMIDVLISGLAHNKIGTVNYTQGHYEQGRFSLGFSDGTYQAGTQKVAAMLIIDSVERKGGRKYDGSQDYVILPRVNLADDFATDTSADYTSDGSTDYTISSGQLNITSDWNTVVNIHNTDTGFKNHYIEGNVYRGSQHTSTTGKLFFRYNKTTNSGYGVGIENGRVYVRGYVAGVPTGDYDMYNGAYAEDTLYNIKVSIIDQTIKVWVDNVLVLTSTALQDHTDGTHVGVGGTNQGSLDEAYVDNFQAGVITPWEDSFDTDSSGDYLNIGSNLAVFGGGKVVRSGAWGSATYLYHVGSDTLWTQFKFTHRNASSQLLISMDAVTKTGYIITPQGNDGRIHLSTYTDAVVVWKASVNSQYTSFDADIEYTLLVKRIAAHSFAVYVNGVYAGTVTDSDATYSGGVNAGFDVRAGEADFAEVNYFSCGTYTANNRLELGEQLKNFTSITPSKGTAIIDLENSIETAGFASDGAWHFAPDSNGEVELSSSIDRDSPAIVVHDYPVRTGSLESPTDHLIFHDKMDNIVDGHSPEVGSGTVSTSGNIYFDSENNGVGFGTSDDALPDGSFAIDPVGNINVDKGTITFTLVPHYTGKMGTERPMFYNFGASGIPYFSGRGSKIDDAIDAAYFYYGGTFLTVPNFGEKYLQKDVPIAITFTWFDDGVNVNRWVYINNMLLGHSTDNSHQISLGTVGYIANGYYSTNSNITLQDFKIYDAPLLPYGAYFTGNGEVDTELAHKDIKFYWDCNSTTALLDSGAGLSNITMSLLGSAVIQGINGIGGSARLESLSRVYNTYALYTVLNVGNQFRDQGSCSLYIYCTNLDDSVGLFKFGDQISLAIGTDGHLIFARYGDEAHRINTADGIISANMKHHIRCTWAESSGLRIFVDGTEIPAVSTYSWQDLSNYSLDYLQVGGGYGNGYIDQVFITNNPNTPQIPTINGVPVHAPYMEVT